MIAFNLARSNPVRKMHHDSEINRAVVGTSGDFDGPSPKVPTPKLNILVSRHTRVQQIPTRAAHNLSHNHC